MFLQFVNKNGFYISIKYDTRCQNGDLYLIGYTMSQSIYANPSPYEISHTDYITNQQYETKKGYIAYGGGAVVVADLRSPTWWEDRYLTDQVLLRTTSLTPIKYYKRIQKEDLEVFLCYQTYKNVFLYGCYSIQKQKVSISNIENLWQYSKNQQRYYPQIAVFKDDDNISYCLENLNKI